MNLQLRYSSCVVVLVVLFMVAGASGAAASQAKQAVVSCEEASAPISFAAEEVRAALKSSGFSVQQKSSSDMSKDETPVQVVLAVGGKLAEQGFTVRKTSGKGTVVLRVVGADAVGAMYGGLHLAEQIRLGGGIENIAETDRSPHILRRGIKFNIPLDARTPSFDDSGDAAQRNCAEMWDFAFWEEFLDTLARHRYNTLTLWNPHPFPSIVKLPDYPDVALDDICVTSLPPKQAWRRGHPSFVSDQIKANLKVIKRMTIDEKIDFWRRVMRHAKNRGIDVYFITWNVIVNGADGKYGITDEQDNPKTIAYLRQCTSQCILTYSDLTGIGVTAGEHMQRRDDEFSKEKWLWNSYGMGVVDAKRANPRRSVRFIHRVWQTGIGEVMEDFGDKYPDTFEVGFKYARAHMYSSSRPPFADALCEELKRHRVKCWWNLRNDDIFNFRWGDPDYVREFLLNLPEGLTAGYHMGSDGYVWGREFTSRDPKSPRALEIDKHWYKFMLWGRLGYNPRLDRAFFEQVLAARFPQAPAASLHEAWQTSSKIVPLVNRFHWRDWDFMWAVEGCMDNRGFRTVDHFIEGSPMQRSGIVAIPKYIEAKLAGRKIEGTTPVEVAAKLQQHASQTLTLVADIRAELPPKNAAYRPASLKELRQTLADIEAMARLGNYYSAKILAAVELATFRKTKDAEHQQAAIGHLEEAVEHWQRYAKVAAAGYKPQLLARTGQLDWMMILDQVKHDVETAK